MNGSYSRIRQVSKTRSKSIDLSDLSFPSHIPRSIAKNTPKSLEIKQKSPKNYPRMLDSIAKHEIEDGIGEIFGEILKRKCSVPSHHKDMTEKSFIQTVVKRSFSLKKSSSVSEGYSRIHHESDLTAGHDDYEHLKNSNSLAKAKKKKGKILQACRRLFGF